MADGGALTLKSSIYVPMWSSFGRSDLTLRLRLHWTIPEEEVRVVLEDMHVLWGLRQGSGMSPGWRAIIGVSRRGSAGNARGSWGLPSRGIRRKDLVVDFETRICPAS